MPAVYSERPEVGMNLRWTPVIGGALCALAFYVVLGLFSASLGWNAMRVVNGGGASRFFAVLIGVFLAPIVAGVAGGFVATRLAGVTHERSAMIYGLLAWCLALIVGVTFISGPFSFWRSNVPARVSPGTVSIFGRYAAWAAWSGLSALIGFACTLAGASMGRRSLLGHRLLPRVRFESGPSRRMVERRREDAEIAFRTGVRDDGTAEPLGTPMRRSELEETDVRH